MDQIRAEWRVLEAICRTFPQRAEGEIRELIRIPGFSWGRLLATAVQHKLQVLAAEYFLQDGYVDGLPRRLREHLRDIWRLNLHRHAVFAGEAARIAAAASTASLPLAARKGLVFEWLLYGSRGLRVFHDIDFLVCPEDRKRATTLFLDLGYEVGQLDARDGAPVPLDRKTLIVYGLNPDHLPRFIIRTLDPVVPFMSLDIALSLSWSRSEYQPPTHAALATAAPLDLPGCVRGLPSLSLEYTFADAVLHLFREAFMESVLDSEIAISLAAFLDIVLLCRRVVESGRAGAVRAHLAALDLQKPAGWVIAHVDRLFGTGFLTEFGLADAVTGDFLRSWRSADGEIRRWTGDMRHRLYAGSAP